ncbi:MAG: alpha/beta fold hydrolase [Desulfobacterales bacterium]|nr:alpha/beta fold hydrolase [Desulfobacterales bacterium]
MFSPMRHTFHTSPGADTVFLPGWGFDGQISRLIVPPPCWIYPDSLLDPATLVNDLAALVQQEQLGGIDLVGWSMGGLLALDFARAHPALVRSLTLISLRRRWPAAEIRRLHQDLDRDPRDFLIDFYRKCFLGHRAAAREFVATLQPEYEKNISAHTLDLLHRGLDYLAGADSRPPAGVAVRIIHGRKDIIAPVTEMVDPAGAGVEIVNNSGHLPFLAPECSLNRAVKKDTIRQKFSRAASTYDEQAEVQLETARTLARAVAEQAGTGSIKKILELGCGTGNYTLELAARFPGARILALDFSAEMVAAARHKLAGFANTDFYCTDGERFLAQAEKHEKFQLITANGSMQWFGDLEQAVANIHRLLTPDGRFAGVLFGPRTLEELGQGASQVLGEKIATAASSFPDGKQLKRIFDNHLVSVNITEELICKPYPSVRDLLTHIKKTGTSGWRRRRTPVFTRTRLDRLDDWFQNRYGGCRASYQVFIITARNGYE